MVRSFASGEISPHAWEWIANLRFDGSLVFPGVADRREEDAILSCSDKEAVIDILDAPLRFLLDIVEKWGSTWARFSGDPTRVFLQHSGHGTLAVYIEAAIAQALGCGEGARSAVTGRGEEGRNLRWPAMTMVGSGSISC